MTLASHTRIATTECAPSIKGCRVCRRQGLAILPLRRSLLPKPHIWKHLPEPEISDTQLGMRILRAGFLYVLLDDRIWQAYQVTVDGYLRQFNPYQPRHCNERRLTRACVNQDHDIPASFLNIDTDKYRTASFAFSSDPWPVSVLDAYKALRNIERMQMIDLATARDNPTQYGNYLTTDEPWVQKHVYEYRDFVPGFTSVHGFHSRAHRQSTFRNYLRTARVHPTLGPGVLAIEVDDDVGLVQEYNAMRASWAHARQVWLEEPERAYQHQTSQILLAIRQLHRQWADSKVRVPPLPPGSPIIPGAWEKARARRVDERAAKSDARLEERYDESKRAAFQTTYDTVLGLYQQHIDEYGALYAQAFDSADFRVAMEHDYDGNDRQSGIAYSKTMALCLRGGVSEAANNDTGPTAMLWLQMLTDPQSPIYRAMLMRDKHLLAELLPSFNATGVEDWNDTGRLYAVMKDVVGSDEGKEMRRQQLQTALAEIITAVNAANLRLKALTGPGVECALSRLNTASQFIYNGVSMMQIHIPIKLGEYYALQSKYIRSLQNRLSDSYPGKHQKARPMIIGGLLSLSVMDPSVADRVVNASLWVEGTLEELQKSLAGAKDAAANELSPVEPWPGLVAVSVGLGTLDPSVRHAIAGLKINTHQAKKWVSAGFTGLRGIAGSADFLLALGGLYFMHDALVKNLKAANEIIGERPREAALALEGSSLAVLGAAAEITGIALKSAKYGLEANRLITSTSVIATQAASYADQLIKLGGHTLALTGFVDAAQTGFAAYRTYQTGDHTSMYIYLSSSTLSALSAGTGLKSVSTNQLNLRGALGWTILFSIGAFALSKIAEIKESSMLESWAKRCFFGTGGEIFEDHWSTSESAATAWAELNAITTGMRAIIQFKREKSALGSTDLAMLQPSISYKIIFPYFDKNRASYRWALFLHRRDDEKSHNYISGEPIFEQEHNPTTATTPAITKQSKLLRTREYDYPDYDIPVNTPLLENRVIKSEGEGMVAFLDIYGQIKTHLYMNPNRITGVSFYVTYWPDKETPDVYAELVQTKKI
ncbi:T6SS effector BTH_I2691 family protein [Pseudomonas sp. HR96]|uniref:T6SS effector BTH_I2691 family protein n=1 Tax=Pseudomonas sp. HR96 TaxID=1027966 RepID=UPI002A760424|nr:T6SS effector BTH_I2691 family protein [Pseudomonas sp. HR96]WPO98795.1 T6SS effector BTH_I2691 family protein [Pseudomonas sp. HR96]